MMAMRSWFLAVPLALSICGGVRAADDLILLGGKVNDASTMTLKGSEATSAATVEVFHGRILACLCHKHWGYAAASSYSYGCLGCNGCYGYGSFGSSCYGSGCNGCQGYTGQSYSPGFAAPAQSSSSTAYSAPAMGIYGPPPRTVTPLPPPHPATTVTVTTPRFSLSLGNNGIIIGRAALASGRLTGLTDQPIEAPSSQPMPNPYYRGESLPTPRARPAETFRYDGGPARTVPMPGAVPAPAQDDVRRGVPANRVKAPAKPRLAYPAYGEERPPVAAANPNVLVKNPAR
jgi:hypothetical protein